MATKTAASEHVHSFHIRKARPGPTDAKFIIESFDFALTYLFSIGSSSQWGTVQFSKRPPFVDYVQQSIRDGQDAKTTGCSVLVAEKWDNLNEKVVSCGATIFRSTLPGYIRESEKAMSALKELTNFLYVEILVTDRKVYPLSRGAGETLVEKVKAEARQRPCSTILVDCWDGNDGALIG